MGFRPLAGMSCFPNVLMGFMLDDEFPSPRGDELFRKGGTGNLRAVEFPSPRGDELFLQKQSKISHNF